ncbi:hypothetical protein ACFV3R_02240 [Streptomyces sp. NPDC059740]
MRDLLRAVNLAVFPDEDDDGGGDNGGETAGGCDEGDGCGRS